jgi:HEAT repeats
VRKQLRIAFSVLLAVTGGLLAWLALRSPEPSYRGKTLSHWLAVFDNGDLTAVRDAEAAVRAIGTNGFPYLNRLVCATDPLWKRAIWAFSTKQALVRLRIDRWVPPAGASRARAILAFTALGAAAKADVPALIHLLESQKAPEVRSSVAAALGGIGPEAGAAIPVLARAAQDPNPAVSRSADLALHNIRMDIVPLR